MAKKSGAAGDRSISVGRDAISSNLITGDHNKASAHYERITLPPPNSVNMQQELVKLRESLTGLNSEDSTKIQNALSDAESELKKPKPDKSEVGGAIERVLKYAKEAVGFGELAEKLKPQVINVAAWLGANWHSLLGYVGLSV
jgi:hypothetical protein